MVNVLIAIVSNSFQRVADMEASYSTLIKIGKIIFF